MGFKIGSQHFWSIFCWLDPSLSSEWLEIYCQYVNKNRQYSLKRHFELKTRGNGRSHKKVPVNIFDLHILIDLK
jgi:hypothetical protein